MQKLRVIARDSRLSQIQVQEVAAKFPELVFDTHFLKSFGDKHMAVSLLNGSAPADFFTRELDEAILAGEADLSVHSAKDLPYPLDERLEVIALLPAFDTTDSLVSRSHLTLSQLPAGSVVGTSSPLRRKELLALRPDIVVRGIRGCIEERVRQVHEGGYDAAIVATCALKRLGLEDEIAEVLPFETHPLQGFIAIIAKKGSTLASCFDHDNMLLLQGEVALVGFGPGNPDLLTIAGLKALQKADVIFHDDLIDASFLDNFSAEKIYVGKRSGKHHAEQADINKQLLAAARQGKNVVRLKGGDAMIFAHGGEETEFLKSNLVKVSVIPGITTASALAASALVSLTQREIASSVAFVNGHAKETITPNAETLVYYMGASHLKQIGNALIRQGWAAKTPVLLAYHVSMPDEQLFDTTLDNLDGQYPTPLIALIGDVANLRHKSASAVKRTLYTGLVCPDPTYIHTPLLEIEPVDFTAPDTSRFDFILFTSRNAVGHWFAKTATQPSARVVSIGDTTTAALFAHGISQVEQVDTPNSFGVIDFFSKQPRGQKILIPRSDIALPVIPDGLSKLGFDVTTLTVYRNVRPKDIRRVNLQNIQRVFFSSPSTIDRFIDLYGSLPGHIEYVSQGDITEKYLNQHIKQTQQQ